MNRPFYSEYVRHCMRFYARNTDRPRFNSEVDEKNWCACDRAMLNFNERDTRILLRVYGWYDTLADNVYEVAKADHLDQGIIWDIIKDFERIVARERGLI